MEIKKITHFVVSTVVLIAIMVIITFTFMNHPMGADFTQFLELTDVDLSNLEQFEGVRAALRGTVVVPDTEKMLTIQDQQNIVGYIKIQTTDPHSLRNSLWYEDFKTLNFSLRVNDREIQVRGQPEQIINNPESADASDNGEQLREEDDVIRDKGNPDAYYQVIREGKEYSIFGTLTKNIAGRVVLAPYRVTTAHIQKVKTQAAEINKRLATSQYLLIFLTLALYLVFIFKTGVVDKEQELETSSESTPETNQDKEIETQETES
jgi:hypothetical protein